MPAATSTCRLSVERTHPSEALPHVLGLRVWHWGVGIQRGGARRLLLPAATAAALCACAGSGLRLGLWFRHRAGVEVVVGVHGRLGYAIGLRSGAETRVN